MVCLEHDIKTIRFEMWEYSDRTKIEKHEKTAEKAVEVLVLKIKKLCQHTFEFKEQNRFIKELQANIPLNSCVASADFSQGLYIYIISKLT